MRRMKKEVLPFCDLVAMLLPAYSKNVCGDLFETLNGAVINLHVQKDGKISWVADIPSHSQYLLSWVVDLCLQLLYVQSDISS